MLARLLIAIAACLASRAELPGREPSAIPATGVCAHAGEPFVAPCATLRARLPLGADNIVVRVRPLGARRILGVAGEARRCELPPDVMALLRAEREIQAAVVVRPVSRPRPGRMQFVCVVSFKHLGPDPHHPPLTPVDRDSECTCLDFATTLIRSAVGASSPRMRRVSAAIRRGALSTMDPSTPSP